MGKRKKPEEIQRLLAEADRDLGKGLSVADVCLELGVSEPTYHRWRQRFHSVQADESRRVRQLESEVARLEELVAELLLDNKMLRDVAKKVVTAAQRRACASYLQETYPISEKRASQLLGCSRSTLRYRAADRSAERPLVKAIQRLARQDPRWGYRFIHARLVRQGWTVNLERVRRLWRELGLQRPVRRSRPDKLGPKRGSSANSCVKRPALFKNDVWTYDFVADRTVSGGPLRWLTLVDEYTRECLALYVAASVTGQEVRGVLARVIGWRGAARNIRSDNGSEFVCEALSCWLPQKGTEPIPVAPGSPWENGISESFNSRFRAEFLKREDFEDERDAKEKGDWFRREYNKVRPHSSLGYKAPRQFSDECDAGLHGQPLRENDEVAGPQ
jgi:transposase InsO family protein